MGPWKNDSEFTLKINGVGNLSARLQNAVNTAISRGIRVIEVGPGDCTMDTAVTISDGYATNGSDYKAVPEIRMAGIYKTRITSSIAGPAFVYENASGDVFQYVQIRGFSFTGPGKTVAGSGCLSFSPTTNQRNLVNMVDIEEIAIKNCERGMDFDDSGFMAITRCSFRNTKYGMALGYNIDGLYATKNQFGSNLDLTSSEQENAVWYRYRSPYTAHSTLGASVTITSINKATSLVTTSGAHSLVTGDNVLMTIAGMTEINNLPFKVQYVSATEFYLLDVNTFTVKDLTSYGTFTSGSLKKITYEGLSNNNHTFVQNFFMRCKTVFNVYDHAASTINVTNNYFESCRQYAKLGRPDTSTGPKNVVFGKNHFSRVYLGGVYAAKNAGGSGGTVDGTYTLAFDNSATVGSGAAGTFTVVGGALSSIRMTDFGYGYVSTGLPTVSFAACAGLVGASATITWVGEAWPKIEMVHYDSDASLIMDGNFTDDSNGANGGWVKVGKSGFVQFTGANNLINSGTTALATIINMDNNTTLNANAAAGDISVSLTSTSGTGSVGNVISIQLDNGDIHWTTVSGAAVGSVVPIKCPLPYAATSGNRVEVPYGKKINLAQGTQYLYNAGSASRIINQFNFAGRSTTPALLNRGYGHVPNTSIVEQWDHVAPNAETQSGDPLSVDYTTEINANGALRVNGWVKLKTSTTALPTASATLVGQMYMLGKAGAAVDELWVCRQTGASTYAWAQVTLT